LVGDASYLLDPNRTHEIARGLYRIYFNADLQAYYAEKGKTQARLFTKQKPPVSSAFNDSVV
jgi:hypothetical protein